LILVLYAHPYPAHSRACAALVAAIRDHPDVSIRSLYEMYPDFDIDGDAERAAAERADLIVWLHPFYWYSVPALMKHWFDHVLVKGWAHGDGGVALAGKDCLWATTTGGDADAFSPEGRHRHPFASFVAPIETTARYCGMNWLEPFHVHAAHLCGELALREAGASLRARLDDWSAR
jgi:glutathione-regulated potassium-efflux system ancillary protein KefF